jgi:hypothetical protein
MTAGTPGAIKLPNYPDAKHPDEFQRGLEFQDFVLSVLSKRYGLVFQTFSSRAYQWGEGEGVQPFEIKFDDGCVKYKRLSIEIAEKSSKNRLYWSPSGILRDDNTIFYIHGNREKFWIFFKKHLQILLKKEQPRITDKFGTICTFYIPIERASTLGIEITP